MQHGLLGVAAEVGQKHQPALARVVPHPLGQADGERDELRARLAATEAAVRRIEELADEWPGHLPLIDTLRYLFMSDREFAARYDRAFS